MAHAYFWSWPAWIWENCGTFVPEVFSATCYQHHLGHMTNSPDSEVTQQSREEVKNHRDLKLTGATRIHGTQWPLRKVHGSLRIGVVEIWSVHVCVRAYNIQLSNILQVLRHWNGRFSHNQLETDNEFTRYLPMQMCSHIGIQWVKLWPHISVTWAPLKAFNEITSGTQLMVWIWPDPCVWRGEWERRGRVVI